MLTGGRPGLGKRVGEGVYLAAGRVWDPFVREGGVGGL